ncbi:hypothetical protein HY988_00480 [Candidatus Micrarchaeota archaeon]|nr:hypothetical protein [Candidatus Micrarchaeota archaeon]
MDEKPYRYKVGESKNVILIIAFLLLVIVVAGAFLLYNLLQKNTPLTPLIIPPEINNSNKTNVTTFTCDDNCYYKKATQAGDFSPCIQITNSTFRQQCYVALSNISFDACKLVLDKSASQSCITAFAKTKSDITLCNLLENSYSCQLAVNPCIKDQNRILCEAFYFKNASKCNGDVDCTLNYSITKGDSKACSQISNEVVAAACISAIVGQDKCGALSPGAKIDYCRELYAIYGNNYYLCSKVAKGSSYALDCYSSFASRLGNYSICDQGNLEFNDLWSCYTAYSLQTGDSSACSAIHYLASTSKFQCVFQYAKKYGNAESCEILADISQRLTCYQGVILYSSKTLNWIYCSGITDSDWRNKCYTESAKLQNDINICDNISFNLSKQSCYDAYKLNKTKSK